MHMKLYFIWIILFIAALPGLSQETNNQNEMILDVAARNARYGGYITNSQDISAVSVTTNTMESISLWRMNRIPGYKYLYNATNPLPRFIEMPGKYWLKTNGFGSVISNGVSYNFIAIQTNYGPKTFQTISGRITQEEIQANREQEKQEDLKNGVNQDIRAKEEKLKEAAKALHTGMTPKEVIKIMGQPYTLTTRKEIGLNQYRDDDAKVEELTDYEPYCLMRYTPYKFFSSVKRSGPYQTLELNFDEKGKLWNIYWR